MGNVRGRGAAAAGADADGELGRNGSSIRLELPRGWKVVQLIGMKSRLYGSAVAKSHSICSSPRALC
jgi:hypothetical protein